MPPMISDDESMSDGVDVPESVPAKAPAKGKGKGKAPAKPVSEDEQEDGSDEEDAEDEYVVEKITEHKFARGGVVQYKVKWAGYEDEADMTWEPAENLETASEVLKEYHASIGGPPEPASKGKKKGAQKRTASEALDSPVPSATKKRGGRKSQTNGTETEQAHFTLPKGSWESDVSHVMSIIEEEDPEPSKSGETSKILMGFIQWTDDRKSKHPMKTLRTKCPQALLTYYENHLRFQS